jgi:gamma-glutamyl hercynylcysteine S-oxide synthase
VFASRFPGARSTLWTLVNRNEYDTTGEELAAMYRAGMHHYDL